MIYRTKEETEYDISKLTEPERQLFYTLMKEYENAKTWVEFQLRTAQGIVQEAQRRMGPNWGEYPLYKIQLDLLQNVGVRSGDLTGELSDMLIDKNEKH